jgi:RNA polymerase-binding protein DksA
LDARQREIDKLKVRLEEHRRGLLHRVGAIESDLRQPKDPDSEEAAAESENDEVLERLDQQSRTEYNRVDAALRRIGNDEHGICVDCGKEIQILRLKAIPWASRCVKCARKHQG